MKNSLKDILKEGTKISAITKELDTTSEKKVVNIYNKVVEQLRKDYKTLNDKELEVLNKLIGSFAKGEIWS